MSNEQVERLQNDLTTMRQVMRLDRPYEAADIPAMLLIAAGALVAIPLVIFTSWPHRSILIVTLIPGAIVFGRRYLAAKREKTERPGLWNEYKVAIIVGVFVTPLAVAWMWWSQQQLGTSREAAGASIMFWLGVFGTGVGALDPSRRSYLFGSIAAMAFALAIPALTPRQIGPVSAVVLALIALSTAGFIWWNTRLTNGAQGDSESPV